MYKLKIKKCRQLRKITQEQLAEKINISQNYLSEVEHNKYDIKVSLLLEIAKALEVCPKKLISCSNCSNCVKKQV